MPTPSTTSDARAGDEPAADERADDEPDDEPTEVLPADGPSGSPARGAVDDTTADLAATTDPGPVTPTSALPPTSLPATEQPTQAGMPVFEDDGTVGWIARRTVPPPPPEAPEAPAVKPLFAPEPPPGTPARRPRHPAGDSASASTGGWTNTGTGGGTGTGSREFWPWDTSGTGTGTGSGALSLEEPDQPVPGRRWLRLAVLVAGIALGLLVGVILLNLSRGRTPLGSEPSTPSPSATQAAPRPLTGLSAADLDPQGDPQQENPELAAAAVDGDPASAWRTETYRQQLGPGGLKTGVGLVVDLGQRRAVDSVDLTFLGSPTSFSLYLTDDSPSAVDDLSPVATDRAGGAAVSVDLPDDARGRYVTVWLTALPDVAGGFRGEVAEVVVLS